MPELPEVETTCRGIAPHMVDRTVTRVEIRQPRLRWPIPVEIAKEWPGLRVQQIARRAKYILLHSGDGGALIHLGMSGSLRMLPTPESPGKHDHVDVHLDNGWRLRYTDPRRFGAVLWTSEALDQHPLLLELGPEPLSDDFDGQHLYRLSRKRQGAVKNFVMDGGIVVGVGNIYASESLFRAGIHPRRPAGRISLQRYQTLATAIKEVLAEAIQAGGTTLRDFVGGDGKPGYFTQSLRVYDRAGEPCMRCKAPVRREVIGQRASYFCSDCQR